MNYEHLMARVGAERDQAPSAATGVDRRSFLKLGAASGFALGIFSAGGASAADAASSALKPHQNPAAFVTIDPSGVVTVMVNRLDFGQGVLTGLPMLVAEE